MAEQHSHTGMCSGCERGLPVKDGEHYRTAWRDDKRTPYFAEPYIAEHFPCTREAQSDEDVSK